jgi:hypothetical protein
VQQFEGAVQPDTPPTHSTDDGGGDRQTQSNQKASEADRRHPPSLVARLGSSLRVPTTWRPARRPRTIGCSGACGEQEKYETTKRESECSGFHSPILARRLRPFRCPRAGMTTTVF